MKLKDEKGWNKTVEINSKDPYSKCCIDYARTWMELMEERLRNGERLEDMAQETSREADKEYRITGFMYGMVVSIISSVWKYGDQLRKWHNAQYGQPDAEGTVNPAILILKKKEDS